MSRALATAIATAILLPAGALAQGGGADRGDWRSPERWARLRLGMGPAEVVRLLGEPGRITRYYAFTRWEYPDALGRRVNFDERGRLIAWGPLAR